MKIIKFLTICTLAALLAGCACGNKINVETTRTKTIGSELIDLQKAKDSGAISESEYKASKKRLIEAINNPNLIHYTGDDL